MMKLKKAKQFRTIGTAVSLALLLAVGTVNAAGNGNGNGKSNSPKDGGGASIGVSNVCTVNDTYEGAELVVTTTIIDKTTGKVDKTTGEFKSTPPDFGSDGVVTLQQKVRSNPRWQRVMVGDDPVSEIIGNTPDSYPDKNDFDPDEGGSSSNTYTTNISLCADEAPLVDDYAKALGALVRVDLINDTKEAYFLSRCGDDPTTGGDESKINLAMYNLTTLCAPPPPPMSE